MYIYYRYLYFKIVYKMLFENKNQIQIWGNILFGYSIKIRINFHYVHEENFSLQNFNISTPILNK